MNHQLRLLISIPLVIVLAACKEPNTPAPAAPATPTTSSATSPALATGSVAAVPVDQEGRGAGTLCNLEFVDGQAFAAGPAPAAAGAVIRGWLGDESGAAPLAPMLVVQAQSADTAVSIPIVLDIARSDVARAFPARTGLGNSGFEASLQPASLVAGQYHLYLTYSIGTEGRLCDNGRHIVISAG